MTDVMKLEILHMQSGTAIAAHRGTQASPYNLQGHSPSTQIRRTGSVELGEICRTASAISMFLEEAEQRPLINRLLSMPSVPRPPSLMDGQASLLTTMQPGRMHHVSEATRPSVHILSYPFQWPDDGSWHKAHKIAHAEGMAVLDCMHNPVLVSPA